MARCALVRKEKVLRDILTAHAIVVTPLGALSDEFGKYTVSNS